MNTESLLSQLESSPESLDFKDVIAVIESSYVFSPTGFQCGEIHNAAGSNEGSCKILAFAKLHNIAAQQTPYLFGHFYRDEVLKDPNGESHANIRNFLKHGWEQVVFDDEPLRPR